MTKINKSGKGILVLTVWDSKGPLISSYVNGLLSNLEKVVSPLLDIHLVTFDSDVQSLDRPETDSTNNARIIHKALPRVTSKSANLPVHIINIIRLVSYVRKNNIRMIHAFCTPAGALAYLVNRLTGIPYLIDSFEPHAETMIETGVWSKKSLKFKLLFALEKWQTKRAKYLIPLTARMKEYAMSRYNYNMSGEYRVRPSVIDFEEYGGFSCPPNRTEAVKIDRSIVGVYSGKFGSIYYDKEILLFTKACIDYWKGDFCMIFLNNYGKSEFKTKVEAYGIRDSNYVHHYASRTEMPQYLNQADFGLVAVKPTPSNRYCSPIKTAEYWAVGLPVVIPSGISDDADIVKEEGIGVVVQTFECVDYKPVLEKLEGYLNNKGLSEHIRKVGRRHRDIGLASKIYKELYSDMMTV